MTNNTRFLSSAACAVFLIGAAAFSAAAPRGAKTVPYEVIEEGTDSAFPDKGPVLDLFADEGRFDSFYAALHMNRVRRKAPPPVDFGTRLVLYISFGRKMTGGYSVRVLNARTWRRTLVVRAQLVKPLPDSFLTQMITNPYLLVAVPRAGTSGLKYDYVELHDWTGDFIVRRRFRAR